ncbi:ParB/RepB/Spo0J family partition protein [Streptomyces sp. NBC_01216]|uniref:ParB/RepB/Spo0J family partition protein n=1 Tax=unclassified Streptomyces TaxID=2593676 RepID=UPI002E0FBF99|nr:ParB/RepB/Spo0J family partition protein [Streptomyces sp. NBC_01216]
MESTDKRLELPTNFTHRVHIEALLPADSPRLNGVDESHVRRLADTYASLPPILVHRPTMRVIDGSHRVAAAVLAGRDSVEAHYFDGPEEDAFLRSVSANTAHGLPLTVSDRKAAAARILRSHTDLSDRAVATYTGLDAKTVAAVRRSSTEDARRSNTRVGSDGKAHPLDRTTERLHAARLMASRPDLPLRAIVKETGLSLGTAHDVRQRLRRGESPVPDQRRGTVAARDGATAPAPPDAGAPAAATTARASGPSAGSAARQPAVGASGRTRTSLETLRNLAGDPSLRHSESGRHFLRWLHTHFLVDDSWRQQLDAVPPHCAATVAELALQCAQTWRRFAEDLSSRRLTDIAPSATARPASESRH